MDQLQTLEATVVQRMAELQPLVDEYAELQQVAERLGVKPAAKTAAAKPASRATASRSRSRRKASTNGAQAATARPARRSRKTTRSPRRSERAEQILAMVAEQPGISVAEIGKRTGVDATGLYRPVRRLQKEGKLRKKGTELHVKA